MAEHLCAPEAVPVYLAGVAISSRNLAKLEALQDESLMAILNYEEMTAYKKMLGREQCSKSWIVYLEMSNAPRWYGPRYKRRWSAVRPAAGSKRIGGPSLSLRTRELEADPHFRRVSMAALATTEDNKKLEETLALQRKDVRARGVCFNNQFCRWDEITRASRGIHHEEPFSRAAAAPAVSNAERHVAQIPKISSILTVFVWGYPPSALM